MIVAVTVTTMTVAASLHSGNAHSDARTADTAVRLRDVREVSGADTADTAVRLPDVREVVGRVDERVIE
jgi:hypothetical protein